VSTRPATNGQAVIVAEAPSGLVLFSSGVAGQVVGRHLSELAELDRYALFHPDGRRYAPSEWMLARSLASEEVIVDEEFFRLAGDGSRLSCRASSYPVYDARGRLMAAVSVASDVTGELREGDARAEARDVVADVRRAEPQVRAAIYDLRLDAEESRPIRELLEERVSVQGELAGAVEVSDDGTRETRILLVEDHAAVREAIAAMFGRAAGFAVVGQAGSLAEARPMLEDVDVAVVDLGLPDGFGGDLIKELREVNPRAQALVLSAGLDRREIARAIESGAAGALDKTVSLDEVVGAVSRLRAGETLVPLEELVDLLRLAARQRDSEHRDRQAIQSLSRREREVLQLLAEGLGSKEVADRLQIAVRTERNHVASILAKLGVHSRLQAVVLALRYEIVKVR
jgi:DNA-binding NarL/FixJ family response regulator